MSTPAVRDIVSFSFRKTKEILFPFRFKRWLTILFIVWLAGHISGGINFNIPNRGILPPQNQQAGAPPQQDTAVDPTGRKTAPSDSVSNTSRPSSTDLVPAGLSPVAVTPPVAAGPENAAAGGLPVLVTLLIVFLSLPLLIFFMWLSARFNFLFLDVMTGHEMGIRPSFQAHKDMGNAYFRWSLSFLLCVLGALVIVALFIWLTVAAGGVIKILLGVLTALLALSFFLGVVLVATFVTDFFLPVMYQEKIPTSQAIARFFSFHPRMGDLAFYFLVKLGLGIVAGIVALVATLAAALAVGLAAGLLVLGGFLLAWGAPFLKAALLVIAAILLVPAIITLVIAIGLVNLPIAIFFRAFALSDLNRLVPRYNLLHFPQNAS